MSTCKVVFELLRSSKGYDDFFPIIVSSYVAFRVGDHIHELSQRPVSLNTVQYVIICLRSLLALYRVAWDKSFDRPRRRTPRSGQSLRRGYWKFRPHPKADAKRREHADPRSLQRRRHQGERPTSTGWRDASASWRPGFKLALEVAFRFYARNLAWSETTCTEGRLDPIQELGQLRDT